MVVGVGHPLHVILDEALGAAVDLLVEILGVEGLEMLATELGQDPASRQLRSGAASPARLRWGAGTARQLELALPASTGRRQRGSRRRHAGNGPSMPTRHHRRGRTAPAGQRRRACPVLREVAGARRARSSGAAAPRRSSTVASGRNYRRILHRGRAQRQHRVVELLDLIDQRLALGFKPFAAPSRTASSASFKVPVLPALVQHRQRLIRVKLVPVLVISAGS